MGVITWIRAASCGWPELLRDAPPELVHPRGDGWVLAREGEATTGLQLGATGPDLSIRLPLFSGPHELTLAERFVPMIARAAGGRIEVVDRLLTPELYGKALEQIAPQLFDHAMEQMLKLAASPAVLHVEGWRRPYFLGRLTISHLLERFPADELFERVIGVIAAMQAYPDHKVAPLIGVARDGRRSIMSQWDIEDELLIPLCDELAISNGAERWVVPHARLAEVISPHAVRLDDVHWLVLPPPEDGVDALMARAKAASE